MDCKIGVRSFAEKEAKNTKPRPDLYKRLIDLGGKDYCTPEEIEAQSCTKFRWMSFNDGLTSTKSLGFRVDGIAHSGDGGDVARSELKACRTNELVAECIRKHFLPTPEVKIAGESEADAEKRKNKLQKRTAEMML